MKLSNAVRCRLVRRRIDRVVLGAEQPSPQSDRHAAECLRCQAEAARYRAMERGFAALGEEIATAPPDLVGRVMAGLDESPIRNLHRRIAVSVSAVSALAIAGSVAVVRRRRHAHA